MRQLSGLLGGFLQWQQLKCAGGGLLSRGKKLDWTACCLLLSHHLFPPPHAHLPFSPGHSAISLLVHPHTSVYPDTLSLEAFCMHCSHLKDSWSLFHTNCYLSFDSQHTYHFWELFPILRERVNCPFNALNSLDCNHLFPHLVPPLDCKLLGRVGIFFTVVAPLCSTVFGPAHSRCFVNIWWLMFHT